MGCVCGQGCNIFMLQCHQPVHRLTATKKILHFRTPFSSLDLQVVLHKMPASISHNPTLSLLFPALGKSGTRTKVSPSDEGN